MKRKTVKQKPVKYKVKNAVVKPAVLDIDALFAEVHAPPQPKKGRRRKAAHTSEFDYEPDPRRVELLKNIKQLYKDEGQGWFHDVNPPEKYSTAQLELHWKRLQEGHRAWKCTYTRSANVLQFLEQIKRRRVDDGQSDSNP